jgi:hypothetical protein
VIEVDGERVGLIAVRPEADAQWIEHFGSTNATALCTITRTRSTSSSLPT